MADAKERHRVEEGSLKLMIDEIEGINREEVAAKLLTLRTNLEVSYQATSITLQMSLASYL